MRKLRCSGCRKEIPRGGLKYIVELRSFADFDGFLEEYEGDIEDGITELLEALEDASAEELEEEVSSEQIFILCKTCRDKFTKDPFSTESAEMESEDVKGTLH